MNPGAKKTLLTIAKFVIPIAIIAFLFMNISPEKWEKLRSQPKNYPLLATALLVALGSISISFSRWCLLVRCQGIELTIVEAFRLGAIGFLLSFVSAGSVGGDVFKAIFLAIGVYMFITVWGILMTEKSEFYVLAALIGTVQGGVQALSRSYYSRLIPKAQAGQFYGFYNMLGKFAAILGPAMIGLVGIVAKGRLMPVAPSPEQIAAVEQAASRWSIGSLLILFLAGGTLLYFVDEEKGRREIARYEEQG